MRPSSDSSAVRVALIASGWLALVLAALGLAALLVHSALPASLVVAAGLALAAGVALVVYRYDVAVAIGTFLLAIVLVEPAPSDALFGLVIAVAAYLLASAAFLGGPPGS